jgi:hypothetical protein
VPLEFQPEGSAALVTQVTVPADGEVDLELTSTANVPTGLLPAVQYPLAQIDAWPGQTSAQINLLPDAPRIAEYYFTYGLALSRLNKCGEALDIVRMINERIPTDELAMENATAIVNRCQQNLIQTPIPPLPTSPPTAPAATTTSTPTP